MDEHAPRWLFDRTCFEWYFVVERQIVGCVLNAGISADAFVWPVSGGEPKMLLHQVRTDRAKDAVIAWWRQHAHEAKQRIEEVAAR